jgi:ATP-binding cassette subfamily F protein uup
MTSTASTDKTKVDLYGERKNGKPLKIKLLKLKQRISEIDTEMNENGSDTELLLDFTKRIRQQNKRT